ncbi:hypothetical protein [Jidongwangia harbinensis]|uniref:hypothetical protein n=1 Tax=Jidongwangia harbinensis TaxID=2878561 RepID=UPI001CDA33A1|nr:hypothetical protein [Jidongwangia harbinensis]MCA2212323.1 hypothetical protein [Jidongwangia harbinensis]
MRVRRTPRIGSADVERLIAGDPTGPEHDGLTALLAAAGAPPSPGELAGERAAAARLSAAYRDAGSVRTRSDVRRTRILPARAVTVKVAAVLAVLAAGGTAVAAETGNLPAAAQHRAHRMFSGLGVPPPENRTTPVDPGRPAGSAPTSTPAPRPSPTAPADRDVPALCRQWQAARDDPGRRMPAEARRALSVAAGGTAKVPAFCAARLAGPSAGPSASPPPGRSGPPAGPGRPSDPGRPADPGKPSGAGPPDRSAKPSPPAGRGNGNGTDRGNGERRIR